MSEEIKNVQEELNEQMQIRRDKLAEYEADGIYPFGQRFVKQHLPMFVINLGIFKYISVKMYWAKRLINT